VEEEKKPLGLWFIDVVVDYWFVELMVVLILAWNTALAHQLADCQKAIIILQENQIAFGRCFERMGVIPVGTIPATCTREIATFPPDVFPGKG
jgi:hypothetical protein